MALPTQWFANRGQMIQTASAAMPLLGALGTGYAKSPVWLTAGLVGVAVGAGVALLATRRATAAAAAQSLPTPLSALTLMSHDFVADDREQIHYKRKLYLQFQNMGTQGLVIGPETTWKHGDMHVKTTREHVWQLEGPNGFRNEDWSAEAVAVIVPPGKRVRTWVGLPLRATKREVDAYVSEHRAGALVTQVAWENRADLAI
ncbi:hypothetical protein [Burkholderia pyrrocinia]|uniref:hypothetical protein n=1 Tax=Burkholderia pyrrocinia TaxID=60550 RepID=UPI001BCDA41C|nr:hypothetical protein [Burkholderia pyrrocinia]QVN17103.1 hypothetical protein JYG32_12540 [Burkholderia pyrrocinia]